MFLELIMDKIGFLPLLIAICYIALIVILETSKGITSGQIIKMVFCTFIMGLIVACIMMKIFIDVYYICSILDEYAIENYLSPMTKDTYVACIEFIWSCIGVGLLFLLWRFIYFHQIIPGIGSFKNRFGNKLKLYKKLLK